MRIVFISIVSFITLTSKAQTLNQWTWICGNDSAPEVGVYGTLGIPTPQNTPPALYEFCQWQDNDGNFWVYGGLLMTGSGNPCNIWKFDPYTAQWTWVRGDGPADAGQCSPFYGTQFVPTSQTRPGLRNFGAPTWTDKQGNLWLFGGMGFDPSGNSGAKGDLWKYDISLNQWVWMHGPQGIDNASTNNGTGTFHPSNSPAARFECDGTWVDSIGNLWLYGGGNIGLQALNDLWVYDVTLDQWACMQAGVMNAAAIYGTQGVSSATNDPGARWVYCTWKDKATDEFYFFGGGGAGGNPSYSDIWKYNRFSGQWTWTDGPNVPLDPGVFIEKCNNDEDNRPEGLMENRARCLDRAGRLWTFSSGASNDLWVYSITDQKWIWVWSGTDPLNDIIITQGTPHPSNEPYPRSGSALWCDSLGNLWLYGGGYTNAMWKFTPDYNCLNYELNGESIFVPNVFTPNGDGVNDAVLFAGYDLELFRFTVFNRWGIKMFSTTDPGSGWDGRTTSGGECTSGVYYYLLEAHIPGKDPVIQNGFIQILR
jgi:gliding motility-associated-like protein